MMNCSQCAVQSVILHNGDKSTVAENAPRLGRSTVDAVDCTHKILMGPRAPAFQCKPGGTHWRHSPSNHRESDGQATVKL